MVEPPKKPRIRKTAQAALQENEPESTPTKRTVSRRRAAESSPESENVPGLLEGVSLEAMTEIFNADKNKVIRYKGESSGASTDKALNTITGEPYVGCGLAGESLKKRNIPALYYNAKVHKPYLAVGESGTGKTSIAECFAQNFGNADINKIMKFKNTWTQDQIDEIVDQKIEPVLRVQNYNGILPEAIVGEWAAIKMLFAEKGEDIFDPTKFFHMGALSKAFDDPAYDGKIGKESKYKGKVVILDEVTRASEDTMNVYLEALRERKITTEGLCFGECTKDIKRPFAYVALTANEGDVGTIDPPSALQTRVSRDTVDFIEAAEEEKIVQNVLVKSGASQDVIDYATDPQTGVRCLVQHFRQTKPLKVKPNVGDTKNIAETFQNMNVTSARMAEKIAGPKLKNQLGTVMLSILGKNSDDAARVIADFQPPNGKCGITLAKR